MESEADDFSESLWDSLSALWGSQGPDKFYSKDWFNLIQHNSPWGF